jgi:hypothetical protein
MHPMTLCTGQNGCGCSIVSASLAITGSGGSGDPWTVEITDGVRTAYTPALTASTTNPTLGSTGTATGHYVRTGDLVLVGFAFTFGGTGISSGSGTYTISLPVTPQVLGSSSAQGMGQGLVRVHDATGAVARELKGLALGGGVQLWAMDLATYTAPVAAITNSTIGITFNSGDALAGQVVYPAP